MVPDGPGMAPYHSQTLFGACFVHRYVSHDANVDGLDSSLLFIWTPFVNKTEIMYKWVLVKPFLFEHAIWKRGPPMAAPAKPQRTRWPCTLSWAPKVLMYPPCFLLWHLPGPSYTGTTYATPGDALSSSWRRRQWNAWDASPWEVHACGGPRYRLCSKGSALDKGSRVGYMLTQTKFILSQCCVQLLWVRIRDICICADLTPTWWIACGDIHFGAMVPQDLPHNATQTKRQPKDPRQG